MSENQGGDVLARGGTSAQFRASSPKVTQGKWDEAFPDAISSFEERLKKRAIAEGLTEEQYNQQRIEAETQVKNLLEAERQKLIEDEKAVKIRAVQDRIIVQRVEVEEKIGALFTPDDAKEKPYEGDVLAVGPGRFFNGEFIPTTVKVGERVVFGKFSGAEVKIGFRTVLVLREEDIFLIKEKGETN
jgi:chaperonin GroES